MKMLTAPKIAAKSYNFTLNSWLGENWCFRMGLCKFSHVKFNMLTNTGFEQVKINFNSKWLLNSFLQKFMSIKLMELYLKSDNLS